MSVTVTDGVAAIEALEGSHGLLFWISSGIPTPSTGGHLAKWPAMYVPRMCTLGILQHLSLSSLLPLTGCVSEPG